MLYLFISLFLNCISIDHEFYVSITELNIKQQRLHISISVFADDLELAINQQFTNDKIDILSSKDKEKSIRQLNKYISSKVVAVQNNERINLSIENYTVHGNQCALTLISDTHIDLTSNILFSNHLLFELFDGQKNIIHYKNQGFETAFICDDLNDKLILKQRS